MKYLEQVQLGMNLLVEQPNSIFVGQAVTYPGTAITHQVKGFPKEKLLEFPVAEDAQCGFCIGLALEGYLPISLYPRCNFMLLAANQIVNHLDKWELMGGGKIKVITKMVVGSDYPLNAGHQHTQNFSRAFKDLCETIEVVELISAHKVLPAYRRALDIEGSTILIEHANMYS